MQTAESAVVDLVRDLDGRVPVALICVDERGMIHAAALPAGVRRPSRPLEARPLESAFADVGGTVDASRERLDREGRARVRVALADDPQGFPIEADLVRIEHLGEDCTSPGSYEDLVRAIRCIAHDLQNPIASLRGFTRLLRTDLGTLLDERSQGYVASLESNIEKVQGLIQTLVRHCRIPERETRREFVPMHMVFAKLALELKHDLDERGIRLDLDPNPAPVFANPDRLQQVVLNLVSNAMQHMGNVEDPRISVELHERGDVTILIVRDNGNGIATGEQVRLHELFDRGGRDESRGSGLGLGIVERIMRAHGGRVDFESDPARGTTFRAYFPNGASVRT